MTQNTAPKPMHQSMTVRAAAATALAFFATLVLKWTGVAVPPEAQEAILVLGGFAITYFLRRGVEASKGAR